MSAVPQWHWPPFHWQTWPGAIGAYLGPNGSVSICSALDGMFGLSRQQDPTELPVRMNRR
jgi:hypothetical protein